MTRSVPGLFKDNCRTLSIDAISILSTYMGLPLRFDITYSISFRILFVNFQLLNYIAKLNSPL